MILGGDEVIPFADVLSVWECDSELPPALLMDIGHIGNGEDTLNIILTVADQTILPQTQADLALVSGFATASFIVNQDVDYQPIRLDITDNMNGISPDSVLLFMITGMDTIGLAGGREAGFLIDNIRFDALSSVSISELSEPINVYPVPFTDRLNIDNQNGDINAKVHDLQGRLVKSFDVPSGNSEFMMSDIQGIGQYILELNAIDKLEKSTFKIFKSIE